MPYREFLDFTLQTAQKAANLITDFAEKPYEVECKGGNIRDIVTSADKSVEKIIVDEIRRAYPDHDILGEEGNETAKGSDYRWIIDPIDGTNNFTHKLPFFAVSIALEYRKEIIIGVIHAPRLNEVFSAAKGQGAFLNNRRVEVSSCQKVASAILATGFVSTGRDKILPYFDKMIDTCHAIRMCGSAALDLCFVACGRIDGLWEIGLSSWDIAAGSLILTEAGGQISNMDGETFNLDAKNILATNGRIHQEMVEKLAI